MIGNILKVIVTLVFGYALGWILGAMTGVFMGAIPSLFFREIVDARQEILLSLALSLALGGLLGFITIQIINKAFTASKKPMVGVAFGMAIGLVVVFFLVGMINFSDIDIFNQSYYVFPIIYGGMLGGNIGSIVFSALGGISAVQDIVKSGREADLNKERMRQINLSLTMRSSGEEKHE